MDKFSLAAFQEACQASGPLCLEVDGHDTDGRRLQLDRPFAVLGSGARAHVRVNDPQLNARHAYLQIIGGAAFVFDLESRAGTRWGNRTCDAGWVGADEPLALGCRTVRVLHPLGAGIPAFDPLTPGVQEGVAFPHLEIAADGERPSQWTANRALFLIGKSERCKVRLHSPEISRFHAAVLSTPRGTWIVDLLSRNGMHVNGKKAEAARLEPGDELRLGRFLIRLHAQTPRSNAANRNGKHPASPLYPSVEIPGALQPVFAGGGLNALPPHLPNFPTGPQHPLMESLVAPLIHQFSSMQNQMFEQFQQNLMMLFQMFQVTQREQLGLIREELREVQEITQKLNALQSELAGSQTGPPEMPAAAKNGASPPPPPLPVSHLEPPALPQSALRNGNGQAGGHGGPAKQPSAAFSENPPPRDVHGTIHERIRLLQQDRQNRWQRIMTFLIGK